MSWQLKSSQFKTLADFCNDVAKGVMLAVIVGQGVLGNIIGIERLVVSLAWVFISLSLLYFAVIFSQY